MIQRTISIAAALLLGLPCLAASQTATLSLEDALELARAANPTLQAARYRADAAWERAPQAGALPDLRLALGLMNRRVGDFDSTNDPMTRNTVQLVQAFPWPGKLGSSEDRAEHLAQAEQLNAEETERRIMAQVKSVYYRIAYMDRALVIMEETRELLRDFLQVSTAMYTVGSAQQQDVLQAQISVAQMTEDITVMRQNRVAMAARLNALLGRVPTGTIGDLEFDMAVVEVPAVSGLMELAVMNRPALRAARERVLAAEAGHKAARRSVYPDFTLMLEYGQRPQFNDLATVMVGISIPIWSGSRNLPDEMQAIQVMEEAKELDLYNETFATLAELRAEAERARSLSNLYGGSILPQARAAVESALSAYRVGEVDYMTLLANEMTVNRYRIESVRLIAEYQSAVARVEAIVGGSLEGVR